ncbi:hypothetical protein N7536_006207 [Penicillium majusculum]|nr:hypothetical protein N7536_006207 [Penicillium majusculum]
MDVQFLQEVASGRILRLFTCEIKIVRPSTPAHGSATPEHTGEPERQSMPIIAGWRRSSAKTGYEIEGQHMYLKSALIYGYQGAAPQGIRQRQCISHSPAQIDDSTQTAGSK